MTILPAAAPATCTVTSGGDAGWHVRIDGTNGLQSRSGGQQLRARRRHGMHENLRIRLSKTGA